MNYEALISRRNLLLAWRRINTAANYNHKRYFRNLYYAYETAVNANLRDLHIRLKTNIYKPKKPIRFYIPKASGLQRPITLLSIEDQIVYQALANIFALKVYKARKQIELVSVFSSVLQEPTSSIFFVEDWRETFSKYEQKIYSHFHSGNQWIAHFDLAAFYDTISHDLLFKRTFPISRDSKFRTSVKEWLEAWTSDDRTCGLNHGIPQGPSSSEFLSDCFMLPIDLAMSKNHKYVRYVDDIRIFAKDEKEARCAAMELEILCRNSGLIPQTKKFKIDKANTIKDALGMLPSIAPPDKSVKCVSLKEDKAIKVLKEAVEPHNLEIKDKTKLRYVLFRAGPSDYILELATKLLPKYPEHVDATTAYFLNYDRSKIVVAEALKTLSSSPYGFVRGEMWQLLARMLDEKLMKKMINRALAELNNKSADFSLRWGVYEFLLTAESKGIGHNIRAFKKENPYIQSLLIPKQPEGYYGKTKYLSKLIRSSSYEPAILLVDQLARRGITLSQLNVASSEMPSQSKNVYESVGLIRTSKSKIDPIGEMLERRYEYREKYDWHPLLGKEYVHMQQMLSSADAVYESGPSWWLQNQNSFNHALFLRIQDKLNNENLAGVTTVIGKDGKPVDYGVCLDKTNKFSKAHPEISKAFREMNIRRNRLPSAHPYDKKTGLKNKYLNRAEKFELWKLMRITLLKIVKL